MCNNLIIIIIGFLGASAFYGISPSEGSFEASHISAAGLLVTSGEELQDVSMVSQSDLILSIESTSTSSFVLGAAPDAGNTQFEWSSSSLSELRLDNELSPTAHMRVKTVQWGDGGRPNKTDILFNPGGNQDGVVVLSGSLELHRDMMKTKNSSLILKPSVDKDIIMSPTRGGRVHSTGSTWNAGALKVQLQGGERQLDVSPNFDKVCHFK